jgi:GT2 family glycosyltransferase
MNISLLVALRNNLDYNKHFYKTTRAVYPEAEICFSSYGSTDGTHEWLDSLEDPFVKTFHSNEYGNFSDNYNKAASLATKDYVVFIHNDIVLAPGFLENIEKHLSPNNVVAYTTIEPPIFAGHERPGKIIKDLGIDLESFDLQGLYKFSSEKQIEFKDQTEPGIGFFMCMPKDRYLEIGGLHNLFNPMFCEDDDLILRWKLLGLNLFTSLDAICYHFVSKTSRFSDEYQKQTQRIEHNSNRNFIRKWGFRNSQHNVKYDIGFVVTNCGLPLLEILEPWCSTIYIQDDYDLIVPDYIAKEQENTKYNLKDRVRPYMFDLKDNPNEILVSFDASRLNQQSFQIIQQLSEIIKESGEVGSFELDIFTIEIKQMNEYQNNLIVCNTI